MDFGEIEGRNEVDGPYAAACRRRREEEEENDGGGGARVSCDVVWGGGVKYGGRLAAAAASPAHMKGGGGRSREKGGVDGEGRRERESREKMGRERVDDDVFILYFFLRKNYNLLP